MGLGEVYFDISPFYQVSNDSRLQEMHYQISQGPKKACLSLRVMDILVPTVTKLKKGRIIAINDTGSDVLMLLDVLDGSFASSIT